MQALHPADGVDYKRQGYGPDYRREGLGLVVSRNQRCHREEQSVESAGCEEVEPEYRAVVGLGLVVLADQGLGKAAVDEHVAKRYEEVGYGYQAIVLRHQDTGNEYAEHQLQALGGKFLQSVPYQTVGGLAAYGLFHLPVAGSFHLRCIGRPGGAVGFYPVVVEHLGIKAFRQAPFAYSVHRVFPAVPFDAE